MKEAAVQRYHMKASALKVVHAMTSWVCRYPTRYAGICKYVMRLVA